MKGLVYESVGGLLVLLMGTISCTTNPTKDVYTKCMLGCRDHIKALSIKNHVKGTNLSICIEQCGKLPVASGESTATIMQQLDTRGSTIHCKGI
jgi:hypothetical protein